MKCGGARRLAGRPQGDNGDARTWETGITAESWLTGDGGCRSPWRRTTRAGVSFVQRIRGVRESLGMEWLNPSHRVVNAPPYDRPRDRLRRGGALLCLLGDRGLTATGIIEVDFRRKARCRPVPPL